MEYRTSLVAYYMALSIHELATVIDSGPQDRLTTSSEHYFAVPLTFLSEDYNITQRATSLLRKQEELKTLWTCLGVTRDQLMSSWEDWIRLSDKALWRYGLPFDSHQNLSDIYRNFFDGL